MILLSQLRVLEQSFHFQNTIPHTINQFSLSHRTYGHCLYFCHLPSAFFFVRVLHLYQTRGCCIGMCFEVTQVLIRISVLICLKMHSHVQLMRVLRCRHLPNCLFLGIMSFRLHYLTMARFSIYI